jgi:hypothetical protein
VTFRLRLPIKATVWRINVALTYIMRRLHRPIQVTQTGKINKTPISNKKNFTHFFPIFLPCFLLLFRTSLLSISQPSVRPPFFFLALSIAFSSLSMSVSFFS